MVRMGAEVEVQAGRKFMTAAIRTCSSVMRASWRGPAEKEWESQIMLKGADARDG